MNYIHDIAKIMEESYTRVLENAAALEDLVNMRKTLNDILQQGTPNVPAGMPNGMGHVYEAIKEINLGIRELMNKDTEGYRWG